MQGNRLLTIALCALAGCAIAQDAGLTSSAHHPAKAANRGAAATSDDSGNESAAPTPSPAAETGPLDVTMRVRAKAGGELRALAPGDTLKSGDFVEMYVKSSRTAFVYLVQFFPDGTAAVLYPQQGAARVPAGKELRIPAGTDWFQLDEHTGEEHVYLVASLEPLDKVAKTISDQVAEVRRSGHAPKKKVARHHEKKHRTPHRHHHEESTAPEKKETHPVVAMNMATRGLATVSQTGGAPSVSVRGDEDGVVVYRFWFVHK